MCAAINLICDAQLVRNTTVQTVKMYTSCSQPVVHTHCTTSHYSLHSHTALHHTTAYTLTLYYITLQPTLSHCTTSHYSLHSHTALHHTTAYTLTLHCITLQPTLSHCTASHYSLHSHNVNIVFECLPLYKALSHHPDLYQFSQHIFIAPVLICTPPHLNVV